MPRLHTPRIAPLADEEMDADTRSLLGATSGGVGGGRVLNIFRTLAVHPGLLKRWLVFGSHVLVKSSLPARERELAILRVGWKCRAEYEWGQHVAIGRASGLGDDEIRRIAAGPDAPGWSALDAAILRGADELVDDHFLSDGTWNALTAHWSTEQLVDFVFTVGQYTLVSMALNSFGVQLDAGVPGFAETTG
ncbi:MAG: carboxymuconolactone decarboxylase family protein [Proteobacteria bacterium]|nr:MAG: carboxymuconolactone decarboxylase family protein [Pseudomonadota bacterium]